MSSAAFDIATHVLFVVVVVLQTIATKRMSDSFRSMSDQDDRIILFLSGRLADLSPDDKERQFATELFRAMTKRELSRQPDRATPPDDLRTT